jgi:hypothetical protein
MTSTLNWGLPTGLFAAKEQVDIVIAKTNITAKDKNFFMATLPPDI